MQSKNDRSTYETMNYPQEVIPIFRSFSGWSLLCCYYNGLIPIYCYKYFLFSFLRRTQFRVVVITNKLPYYIIVIYNQEYGTIEMGKMSTEKECFDI